MGSDGIIDAGPFNTLPLGYGAEIGNEMWGSDD